MKTMNLFFRSDHFMAIISNINSKKLSDKPDVQDGNGTFCLVTTWRNEGSLLAQFDWFKKNLKI